MMRRRSSLLIPFAFAGLLVPRLAAGQSSSPYVPPTHWATPQLEALIAGRVIPDPSPLLRPFRRMDAVRALRQADTARATRATRATVRRLVAELDDPATDRVRYRADLFFAVRSATHARRNELRDSGPGGTWPALGGWGDATFGPVVLATSIEGDYRLDDDPDYRGGKVGPTTRKVPTRIPVAYLSAQFRFGELLYGALPANWGPAFVEGFALSPEPFSYDALTVRLGTRDRHLGLLATQLDHTVDSTGARVNRYLAAHYLYLRFGPAVALNLWETTLFAGVDRSFDPWFLNPLKLTNYAATDEERVESNNLVGLDLAVSPAGWPRLHLSLYADDLSALVGEDEPFQGGVTVGAQGGLGRGAVSWTAFYTLVSNLSYRASSPAETYQRRGVGLARNQSDYDQLTLRATWSPLPLTVVGPELTLIRQGEGDLRDPFPADLTTAPTLHQGVVERTLRLAIRGDVSVRAGPVGGTLAASAALHHVSNAGHVDGVSDDRFVGF
ncbi:MAG TPA: hypothetical protein VFH97_03690, partial [Gemmatimonadales bacterium]|nr:hypothetical protein [Gemmatimonadales bacterium]